LDFILGDFFKTSKFTEEFLLLGSLGNVLFAGFGLVELIGFVLVELVVLEIVVLELVVLEVEEILAGEEFERLELEEDGLVDEDLLLSLEL
jgi:hypothetical protein